MIFSRFLEDFRVMFGCVLEHFASAFPHSISDSFWVRFAGVSCQECNLSKKCKPSKMQYVSCFFMIFEVCHRPVLSTNCSKMCHNSVCFWACMRWRLLFASSLTPRPSCKFRWLHASDQKSYRAHSRLIQGCNQGSFRAHSGLRKHVDTFSTFA